MPDVIADSSPLQYLHRIGLLDLLYQRYRAVVVPEAVFQEIEAGRAIGADVPNLATLSWIRVESVTGSLRHPTARWLGLGEREAIQLALEKADPLLILDDRDARREAQSLSIRFTVLLEYY